MSDPHPSPVTPADEVDDLASILARIDALERQTPPPRTPVFTREFVFRFPAGAEDIS